MRRQGYTVVEVLAALLILSLTMAALFQGGWAIRRAQAQTAQRIDAGRAGDAARSALVRFLALPGAAGSPLPGRLSGNAAQLSLQCQAGPCVLSLVSDARGARLVAEQAAGRTERALTGLRQPAFRYLTTEGEFGLWPVSADSGGRLVAIALVDDAAGAFPVATVRLWSQQPRDCMFDSISAQCQSPLP